MSSLLILTRPSLVSGFRLAGLEAWAPEDVEAAHELLTGWLESNQENLLAIDDGLFDKLNANLVKQLEESQTLHYIVIPGGRPLGTEASRSYRVAEFIRRAIGFHITFKGKAGEEEV